MAEIDKEDVPEYFDIVAVDSDLIRYRAGFAAQHTYWKLYDSDGNFVEEFNNAKEADEHLKDLSEFMMVETEGYYREPNVVVGTEEQAKAACDLIIDHIKKNVPSGRYEFYLTDSKENYREDISVTEVYKGNRLDTPKPVHHEVVKQHLMDKYGAKIAKSAEADDACCVIGAKGYYSNKINTCVVSSDKDLSGSPGYIFNFTNDVWEYNTELDADRFFWKQCIMGDKQVDNILGLVNVSDEFRKKYKIRKSKGVGKAAADKLLGDCETNEEMFEIVKEAYQSYHGDNWRTVLNEMGKLLWMQRKKGVIFDVSWYED